MKNKICIGLFSSILFLFSCKQHEDTKISMKESNQLNSKEGIEFVELTLKNNETKRERGSLGSLYSSDTVRYYDKNIIIRESIRFQNIVMFKVLDNKSNITIDTLLFDSKFLKSRNIHNSSDIRFIWSEKNGRLQAIDTRNEKDVLFGLLIEKSGKIKLVKD